MLASDFETLPAGVQEGVSEFFERSYAWLERVIDEGVAEGRLPATASSHATAQSLVAGLEGAMLVSRPSAGTRRFEAIADALLASIGVSGAALPRTRMRSSSPTTGVFGFGARFGAETPDLPACRARIAPQDQGRASGRGFRPVDNRSR